MSQIEDTRLSERLLETAAHWVVLLDERPLTEYERKQFRHWILAAESHRIAFQEAASSWGRADILAGLSDLFPLDAPVEPPPARSYRAWYIGAAATAAIVAVAAGWLTPQATDTDIADAQVYRTRVGETATIDLADGSTIIENTDSVLSVEFSEAERRILLDQGEAYFDVEPDPSRVFSVVAGSTTISAVGTAFSVFRDGAAIEVLVSEGVVEVVRDSAVPAGDAANANADERLLIRVGEVAELGPSAATVASIDNEEIARRLFWRQGMLAFEGETLDEVIREFSRYTTVDIRIASDEIREIRVGGYFDSGDLAGMLTALQSNFGIAVTHLGPDQVLLTAAE